VCISVELLVLVLVLVLVLPLLLLVLLPTLVRARVHIRHALRGRILVEMHHTVAVAIPSAAPDTRREGR